MGQEKYTQEIKNKRQALQPAALPLCSHPLGAVRSSGTALVRRGVCEELETSHLSSMVSVPLPSISIRPPTSHISPTKAGEVSLLQCAFFLTLNRALWPPHTNLSTDQLRIGENGWDLLKAYGHASSSWRLCFCVFSCHWWRRSPVILSWSSLTKPRHASSRCPFAAVSLIWLQKLTSLVIFLLCSH